MQLEQGREAIIYEVVILSEPNKIHLMLLSYLKRPKTSDVNQYGWWDQMT